MNHVDVLVWIWVLVCCRRVHLLERRRMALRPIRRRDLPPAQVLWFPHPWPAPTHLPPPPLRPHPALARKYKFYTSNCIVAFAIANFQYTCSYVYGACVSCKLHPFAVMSILCRRRRLYRIVTVVHLSCRSEVTCSSTYAP